MKTSDKSLFELVKSLNKEEVPRVRKLIAPADKEGQSHLQQVFNAFLEMEEHDEKPVKEKFDLAHIKPELYDKVLDALCVIYADEPEIEVNRQLNHTIILEKKNLYAQADAKVDELTKTCNDNFFLFTECIAHYHKSAIGNYLQGNEMKAFAQKMFDDHGVLMDKLKEWNEARKYYLEVYLAEGYRSVPTKGPQSINSDYFTLHDCYSKDIKALHLPTAIYISKARRTIHLKRNEDEKALEAETIVADRIRSKKEVVSPIVHWNWLVDLFNLYDGLGLLDKWESDLKELEELFKKHYAGDKLRKSFILRYWLELNFYKLVSSEPGSPAFLAAQTVLDNATKDAEEFISACKTPLTDIPLAFLFSSILVVYVLQNKWKEAEDCCEDFASKVSQHITPDVQRFVRIMKPITYLEQKKIMAISNWIPPANSYMKNHPGEDYRIDRQVLAFMKDYVMQHEDEHPALYQKLAAEVRNLVEEDTNPNVARNLLKQFDLIVWAEGKLNGDYKL